MRGVCKDYVKTLQTYDYPTVLVARDDNGLDRTLINCLQRNGFHVLEAGIGSTCSMWSECIQDRSICCWWM